VFINSSRAYFTGIDGSNTFYFSANLSTGSSGLSYGWITDGAGTVVALQFATAGSNRLAITNTNMQISTNVNLIAGEVLTVGNTSINTSINSTSVSVGGNVIISTNTLTYSSGYVGNSSVNAISYTQGTTNGYYVFFSNATSGVINVSTSVSMLANQLTYDSGYISNTTVNTRSYSIMNTNGITSSFSTNVVSTSNTASVLTASSLAFYANNLDVAIYQGSTILLGNTTVNTYINSTSISMGNSTVNTVINSSSFTHSIAANGYTKLPGGLILQWGTLNVSSTSGNVATWPLAFPTAVYSVTATAIGGNTVATAYHVVANNIGLTNGTFIIDNLSAVATANIYFQCIGS
jgi:hypothetical protein